MGALDGKVALITGGGTGIGRAIALLFAAEGADVAIAGRRPEPLAATVRDVEARGRRGLAVTCDIGGEQDVVRAVAETADKLGRLDILVNNASVVGQVGPVCDLDLDAWDQAIRVNITGTMLCCREAVRQMKKQGQGGAIVNVSSNVGRRGFPNRAPYVCSKWAMHGLGQTLALELAKDGIRVNTICPGPVMTDRLAGSMARMAATRRLETEEIRREWEAESPMGRFATTDECAQVALFLASDASSAMTGQALNVTCGALMT
ncbi:MAG: SDR family NAD(P)-dependent oxidoreductase [Candidatus Sumerlaeota bacterium]|nr:SDR family NAD(P)-dependent oxidoreductase [Candidatus Sumerlaeota bacterium]